MTLEEALANIYEEYDIEPSEEAAAHGRLVAGLQDWHVASGRPPLKGEAFASNFP